MRVNGLMMKRSLVSHRLVEIAVRDVRATQLDLTGFTDARQTLRRIEHEQLNVFNSLAQWQNLFTVLV
jgi:hypothetical protein